MADNKDAKKHSKNYEKTNTSKKLNDGNKKFGNKKNNNDKNHNDLVNYYPSERKEKGKTLTVKEASSEEDKEEIKFAKLDNESTSSGTMKNPHEHRLLAK